MSNQIYNIVTLGTIYRNDPESEELIAIDGFHVDSLEPIPNAMDFCLCEENANAKQAAGDPEWEQWLAPSTPMHGFAGIPLDQVYRYKFNDENHWKEFDPRPVVEEDSI